MALCVAVFAPSALACPKWHCPKAADTVYKNGYIYTVNPRQPAAQAVAVRDGKIVYVGCNRMAERLVGPNTNVVDLHGKMMMPGLEDGHTHLMGFVACNMGWEGGTEDYILAKIKAALLRDDQIGMLNSNYVLNCSFFEGELMLPAGTLLTRDMLDRLSLPVSSGDPMATGTTRPIVVRNADGHKFHVNSIALNNAGITKDTVAPDGSTIGHYGDNPPDGFAPGDPNGFFSDYSPPAPFGLRAPSPADAQYVGWLNSIQLYNQKGTTSIFQAAGSPNDLPIWQQMADNGDLTMRVNQSLLASWVRGETDPAVLQANIDAFNAARAQYNGYSSPNSPGSLAVDTAKVFADGVVEYPAQTAAMLGPTTSTSAPRTTRSGCPAPCAARIPRSRTRPWA